ncbi:MAG: outer membrane beta-barrel protein [Bacteroidetes bacterium]|nr:outer membrane beta-barrel protein [Bacteroidota bacterium]
MKTWISHYPAASILLILLFAVGGLKAQTYGIHGRILDEQGAPLCYATVTLLHPEDSTLAFYGISNPEGEYNISRITGGEYLLQSAYVGLETFYRRLRFPLPQGETMETIIMKRKAVNLPSVEIEAERIPFLIKEDTIEYSAGSYRTRPDAVAEDLLRQLPGVEVDRNGNIRAMGEDVRNVLVDGREFFSSDPKVATRNLPARTIDKIQVYDKASDQSELTGIPDLQKNKTVNIVLKEEHKSSWFGNLKGGFGTGTHYQGSGKLYRFDKKNQFAALGMVNNINQFGFSFQDYLDFSGGIQNMMSSGNTARITISSDGGLPVDFGQETRGLVTTGAGGLNYSYEPVKDNRFNVSYLGNVNGKKEDGTIHTENYAGSSSFIQDEESKTSSTEGAHQVNLGWKNRSDSIVNYGIQGKFALSGGSGQAENEIRSYSGDTLMNMLDGLNNSKTRQLAGDLRANWMKKGKGKLKLWKTTADISYSRELNRSDWENITRFFGTPLPLYENQYLRNEVNRLDYALDPSLLLQIGKRAYIEPTITAGEEKEWLSREQGIPGNPEQRIDSLSPEFDSKYLYVRPGITFKYNTKKTQTNISASVETGRTSNRLAGTGDVSSPLFYILPGFSWEYEYKTGSRITFFYSSSVNTPGIRQLLPVANTSNPLYLMAGNRYLKPEYSHNVAGQWFLYDAFTFTTLFVTLSGAYTQDKISYSRNIDSRLGQSTTLINVPDDYSASLRSDFSRPVRKLGINLNLGIRESWNKSYSMVNGARNSNINWNHSIRFSVDNRKKEKIDISAGTEFDLTNARYRGDENLNNDYFNLVYFGEVQYYPHPRWNFMVNAEVSNYNAESFGDAVSIPLLRAEISYYFLEDKRAILKLEAYDLLNRNTGISRVSEQNYLRESRYTMMGRYVMLSLTYRLNRFGGNEGWLQMRR